MEEEHSEDFNFLFLAKEKNPKLITCSPQMVNTKKYSN